MRPELYGWGMPPNISAHGAGVDQLIHTLHWFMLLLFVGWAAFMGYTLWRFRARPGHTASYTLPHFRAPTYLEVGVALFELFLLYSLSIPLMAKYRESFPRPEAGKALEVRVVAQQFAWNVHYPGQDRKFGRTEAKRIDDTTNPLGRDPKDPAGQDDVTSVNQLHLPVNTPVIVYVSSKDVIHSFSVPVMRIKQDAIPGEVIPIWFEARETGEYQIACAQLCGDSHFKMIGTFKVDTAEEFAKWLATQGESSSLEE